jgi:arabinose-5-phosphate isomerase
MEKYEFINDLTAADIMSYQPKSIEADELAINALNLMQQKNISQVIVTKQGAFFGFVHLHDLIKEGII